MITKKTCFTLLFLTSVNLVFADTPANLIAGYAAEVAKTASGFSPSAKRGQEFFTKKWGVSQKMPDCTACHGKNISIDGKHVITGKHIAPFSPAVNPERFTKFEKVEKWFKRNCTEVVGRECSASEKADFIQFIAQAS